MKRIRKCAAALAVLLSMAAGAEAAQWPAVTRWPAAAGQNLLIGTWRGRYGEVLSISLETMDGVPYAVDDVTDDGFTTVVRVTLGGGKGRRLAFSFPRSNRRYMMKNDLTSGRFTDAMDYTRQSCRS